MALWLVVLMTSPVAFGAPLQFPLAALENSSCYQSNPPILQTSTTAFDWRDVNRSNWLTPISNQFLPQYCGSCWAHAASSVLSDRLAIAGHQGWILSPQPLLDCCSQCTDGGQGCHRGNDYAAYEFVHQHGLTDTTCAPYVATERWCDLEGSSFCKACYYDGSCRALNATRVFVDQCGFFAATDTNGTYEPRLNVPAMQAEIAQRGPISCSLYHWVPAFTCYVSGIIRATLPPNVTLDTTTHTISLVGWGSEEGVDYWIGKNSMGRHWGENGYFRIERGKNSLNVERWCRWATVKAPTTPGAKFCADNDTKQTVPSRYCRVTGARTRYEFTI